MKATTLITSGFFMATLAQSPVAMAGEVRPALATCLDSEEVIVVVDDADMTVDVDAQARQRNRKKRDQRRARKRRRELERKVAAEESARQQAERRASEAEAALAAEAQAREAAETQRQAQARDDARRMARLEAQASAAGGHPLDAAVRLQIAASTHRDPVLWVEAAERFAEAFDGGDAESGVQALAAAMEAKRVEAAGLSQPQRQEITSRADAILKHVPGVQRDRARTSQLARTQVAIGGSLLAVGAAGFGMLGVGSYLNTAADRERDRVDGLEGVDTSPLEAQEQRARGLMIAGGIVGGAGVILGGTMLGLGLREYVRLHRPSRPDSIRGRAARRRGAGDGRLRARLGPGPTALGATLTLRM